MYNMGQSYEIQQNLKPVKLKTIIYSNAIKYNENDFKRNQSVAIVNIYHLRSDMRNPEAILCFDVATILV